MSGEPTSSSGTPCPKAVAQLCQNQYMNRLKRITVTGRYAASL
jgi:hypothetical protein